MRIWDFIGEPVVSSVAMLIVLAGIIGLICHKSRRHFYIWLLQTTIKLTLFVCALYVTGGVAKYASMCKTSIAGNEAEYFMTWFWSLLGGASPYLLVSLIALIVIAVAEMKQRV